MSEESGVTNRETTGVRMVVFDWGGVILRHCRSWEEACHVAGLDLRFDARAEPGLAARRRLATEYQVGRLNHDEFLDRLRAAVGGTYSIAELNRLHDAWLLDEYSGVADVIQSLNNVGGVETALLSNTNHSHWITHLPGSAAEGGGARYPTAGLLKHRYASHLMGLAKPDPEIYRLFEAQTGCESGGILFFDDLPENIKSARSCGWNAELIDHTMETAPQIREHLARHGVRF